LIKHHSIEVILERKPSLFVRFKVQRVPLFHLRPFQLEMFGRPSAGMMIPAIGEQDATDVEEKGCNRGGSLHDAGNWEVWQIGRVIG
jgi:hypothetical protein